MLVAQHWVLSQARDPESYPDVALGVVLQDDDGTLALHSAHGFVLSRYRQRRPLRTVSDAERADPWAILEEL